MSNIPILGPLSDLKQLEKELHTFYSIQVQLIKLGERKLLQTFYSLAAA